MRLLLCTAGTRGDVLPIIAVASAMKERGHDVTLLTNPAFESLANEAGIGFRGIGHADDIAAMRAHPDAWSYSKGWKVWFRGSGIAPMRELFAAVKELHIPGDTVVGAAYLCVGARIAREVLGVPTATLHVNVHTIRSIHSTCAMPSPGWLPEWVPNFYTLPPGSPAWYRRFMLGIVDRFFFDPVFRKEIERFRGELNLPSLTEYVRDWWNSPDLSIGLFPDWWAGPHHDWPEQAVTTGFPFWDRSESIALPDELHEFLTSAGPVLVFSPGASSGHSPAHLAAYQRVCQQLGRRGLVLTPNPTETRCVDVRFEKFVPFGKLLPHAAAVVHHAGIGTSAQCLAAGVPQVVVPTLYNQPDTAVRLRRLGVASCIKPWKFSATELQTSLAGVLQSSETAASCRKWTTRLADGDALSEICSQLESLQP